MKGALLLVGIQMALRCRHHVAACRHSNGTALSVMNHGVDVPYFALSTFMNHGVDVPYFALSTFVGHTDSMGAHVCTVGDGVRTDVHRWGWHTVRILEKCMTRVGKNIMEQA